MHIYQEIFTRNGICAKGEYNLIEIEQVQLLECYNSNLVWMKDDFMECHFNIKTIFRMLGAQTCKVYFG